MQYFFTCLYKHIQITEIIMSGRPTGFPGQMRRPVGPSTRGHKAPMGLIIGVVVLIIIVVIVIIAVVLSKKDSNTLTAEEQLRENCIGRGDAWNAATQTCTSTTPPGGGSGGGDGGGGGGGGITTEQQRIECIGRGDTWNMATSTCTPNSTPLTPLQLCSQAGGYIGSDGTCVTAATCAASGGTFSTSMLKCSPYTPTSCAAVKGTWNADLLDCLNIPAAAGAPTYTCVCGPRWCGNGAYGADPGQTDTGISATTVESSYRPCITNVAGTTGWTCTNTATGANYCA